MTYAVNPGPLARLEAIKADASAPLLIFSKLAEGESLKQIAREWEVPKGRFCEWFTTSHSDLYDAALKVRAAELAIEAYEAAQGAPRQAVDAQGKPLFDEGGKPVLEVLDVARDKLRADVALKIAGKWDRARYGDSVQVQHSGETVVRLTFGVKAEPRVLENQTERVVALPGAVAVNGVEEI